MRDRRLSHSLAMADVSMGGTLPRLGNDFAASSARSTRWLSYVLVCLAMALCMTLAMFGSGSALADEGGSGSVGDGSAAATSVTKSADPDTSGTYTNSLGSGDSTRYAGRVWTDKTVYVGDATFGGGDAGGVTVKNDSDFLVAYSALATSQRVTSVTPTDTVFVLDFSASMTWSTTGTTVGNSDGSDSRIKLMVDALNDAIDTLAKANPENRIGIVVFNADAYELLPLTSLTEENLQGVVDGNYLELTNFSGTTGQDDGKSNVRCRIKGGTTQPTASKTNIELGLYAGMQMMLNADTQYEVNGVQTTRIPNIVLMSDGAPTTIGRADRQGEWWNGISNADWWGDNNQAWSANGFMPLLMASYMKNAVSEHYYGADATQTANFYTLGFSINHQTDEMVELANLVLNPGANLATADQSRVREIRLIAQAWEQYSSGSGPTVHYVTESSRQQHDLRVEIADNANNPTSLVYPTQYFAAENADDLNTAFQQIAHLITASAKVPTEVTGSPEASGYITYSDPIGEYMEVKDVKSLIFAGQEFTAHTVQGDGADTKTYVFAGEVDSPVYGQHSLSEIMITVTTDSNGNQTLEVKIPASVIPIRTTAVTHNADGSISTSVENAAYPLRILYTVGTRDGVLDANGNVTDMVSEDYIKAHTDPLTGRVAFYSNRYSRNTIDQAGTTVGDATVTFQPAKDNPMYFVQEDTALYVGGAEGVLNAGGTLGTPATSYDPNATYYFLITYYEGDQQVQYVVSRPADLMANYTHVENGQLYLNEGAPRLGNLQDFAQKNKDDNATATASSNYYPTFDGDVATGSFVVYLGNNGRLDAARATGTLRISKTVTMQLGDVPSADDEFTFTVELTNSQDVELPADLTFAYELLDSRTDEPVLDEQTQQPITGTVANGGTVTLKDGQSVLIKDLPDGTKFTVTEQQLPGYGSTLVVVNGAPAAESLKGSGSIDTAQEETANATVGFINAYKPTQTTLDGSVSLVVSKTFAGRPTTGNETFRFEISGTGLAADGMTPIVAPLPVDKDGQPVLVATATLDVTMAASQNTPSTVSGAFGSITFERAGTYTYTVRELVPGEDYVGEKLDKVEYASNYYTVVITVSPDDKGALQVTDTSYTLHADDADTTGTEYTYDPAGGVALNFTNTYAPDPVSVPLAGTKTLENDALVAGEFSFCLASVSVDGTMYDESNSASLPAGTPMPTLNAGTGSEQILGIGSTVTNGVGQDAGAIAFGSVAFDAQTLGHTYAYTFREVVPGEAEGATSNSDGTWTLDGVTYDASEITVSVTPSQNADGTITASPTYSKDGAPAGGLSWVNTYSVSTQVTIAGTKVLENKDLASSGLIFGFTLDGTNGDTTHLETSTVAGDATGAFSFDPIVYDMSDMDGATDNQDGTRTKTFTYEVSEVGAGTMDPATGITYTSVKYTVTVTLTDDGQGNLTADVVYNDGTADVAAMQFVNSYEPSSTQLDSSTSLAVSKTFSGRATTGEETFAFEISGTGVAADGVTAITAPLPADDQGQQITRVEITMPKSDTDPTVSPVMAFDTITFDQAGTYTYTIREVVPQNEGDRLENVGYSTEYYTVTVPVRDNGSGQLVVDGLTYAYHASDEDVTGTEFVYDANGGMSFTNVFTPSPVGVQIWGTKTLEAAALAQGDFSFRLTSVTVDGVVYDADNADQLPADVPMPTFPESSEGTARPVTIGHTVPNDADGSIFFGELTFNEASLNHVYVYSYEEVIPDEATFDDDLGAWVLDGVRYDTVGEQTVSFAPTKNLDGTINASPVYSTGAAGLSWTNTYDTKPGELVGQTSLRVTKALDGRPWNTADEFTFEITDQGNNAGLASNPMPSETTLKLTQASVTEQEDGSQLAGGSFGNISYEVPGTYTYHISEQGTGGNGITVSRAVYEVTVTVEDNGAGALTVSSVTQQLKGDLGEDVSTGGVKDGASAFTNVYATNEAQIVISGTKFLQNKNLASSGLTFGFELRGTGDDATSLTASTTPGDCTGAFAFPAITYDESDMAGATVGEDGITRTKVLAYTVSEVGGGQVDANGITHDDTVYNVYVTLTDDGMGNLTADVSYDEGVDGIAFTNIYAEKATTEVTFDITKTLTGRDMAADTFSFLVKDAAGQTVATASNAAAAAGQPAVSQFTLKFGIATIDKADPATVVIDPVTGARSVTLHYTVCELHGDSAAPINGVTYDPAVYDISVIVTDNGDGTMSAVPIYPEGVTSLSFENSYAASGSFTPSGMKSTYVPDGANPAASGFSFAVVDENGQTVTMGSTTGLDGAIDFGEITITSPGEHIYWISEINSGAAGIDYDESIYKLVVNMEDLGNGQLQETSHAYYDAAGNPLGTDYVSFNNTYGGEGTSISLSARKVLEGAALEAGQFSFEVVDENGTVVAGGTNNASGVFSFSIPYTYTVQQADQPDQSDVADQSQAADSVAGDAASVDAVASDGSIESDVTQGDGANSPDVTDPSQASGVEGEGQSDDSSVIGVPDGEGNTDSSVEAPSEDAGVDLGTDQPPAGGTADEVIGGDQTGTSGQPVEGQAIEDGEPDQTSEAVEADALSLGDLLAPTQAIADDQDAEQFMAPEASAAVVADAATDPVVSETPANEGGEGSSDDMTGGTQVVSSSLGTHYYTIREVIPAGATQNADGTYTLDGVTYDQSSYRFSVTVVDNGDGTMSAHLNTGEKDIIHFFADGTSLPVTPAGDDGMYNVVFTNVYEPTNPAKVNLEGTKMLTGRDMAAGEFSFEVRDAATGELVTTGRSTASADGTASSISFVEFTYDSAGEYDLAVSEVQGDPDVTDITYDSRTFGAHVSVTDDGAGNLVANVTYDEPVAFSNSYTQTFESTSVNIQAVKTLTGRAMEDGEFSFSVIDPITDEVVATAQSMAAADGEQVVIDFTQIWYSEPGEYEYIVIENAGSDETIAYDTTTYRVFVSVTADADGTLTAEASYPDGTPSFVNEYTPDDEPGDDPGDDPGDTPGGDEPGDDPTDPGTDPGGSTGGKDPEKEQISETGDASVATGALAAMVAAGAGLAGVGVAAGLRSKREKA